MPTCRSQGGNPLSYYNGKSYTFTWEEGRSLVGAVSDTNTISYAYDQNGLRLSKTVNGIKHEYLYASGKLLRETVYDTEGNVTDTLDFFYQHNGYPYSLKHNGTVYYYITNLQGDVMKLVDEDGSIVAEYSYDPYGKLLINAQEGAIDAINPLRYRGYYYDSDLDMYYLQSRYYDPNTGRFINPDILVSTGQGMVGNNMFAYCNNNPIDYCDASGCIPKKVMNIVNALNITTILIAFAYALYMTPTTALASIGLHVTTVLLPKVTAVLWHQPWAVVGIVAAAVAIVVAAVTVAHNNAVQKAHQEILKTVKKSAKYQYWSANLGKGYVDIGRPLTFAEAVAEVAAGRNVFTVTSIQAEAVARAAGGGLDPVPDKAHRNGRIGYYNHYHVYGRTGEAHVWYLF